MSLSLKKVDKLLVARAPVYRKQEVAFEECDTTAAFLVDMLGEMAHDDARLFDEAPCDLVFSLHDGLETANDMDAILWCARWDCR